MVMSVEVNYRYPGLEAGPDMNWGLLIRNISRQDGMQVTCSWQGNQENEMEVLDYPSKYEYDDENTEDEIDSNMNDSSSGTSIPPSENLDFKDFAVDGTHFPCNDSVASNWTQMAVSWNPHEITKAALSMKIQQTAPYQLRVSSDTISLLLPSVTFRDAGNYSCYWKNQSQHIRLEVSAKSGTSIPPSENPVFNDFAVDGTHFPCNDSVASNWTQMAVSWNPHEITKAALSMKIQQTAPYQLRVSSDTISLLLPSVTFRDAGNYSCYWKNQSQHIRLEVSAKSEAVNSSTTPGVKLYFGKQHWIIWIVALGYVAICLGIFFGLLRFRRGEQGCFRGAQDASLQGAPTWKKGLLPQKFFQAQRNREPASGRILLPSANGDGKEPADIFSYENVLPNVSPSGGQQSLQKGNTLPTATKVEEEDDDEEYEHPDSETEQKSDDEDNYENTQEEVKQEDVVLNADCWYANNSQKGLQDLAQDPVSEDGDNYENVEEESSLSPGAARLIAGLRLQLALDPPVDKQDGGSEASTGSQSYEEMNGTLSPTPSKGLHTSNEEDADSYENMESPNSFSLQKESTLDPQGDRAAFGSVRQNLSISFGTDL
ncbi:PREDICTED: B-lymphocyte antigen CD19 [Gekko japonicus]|uniref:B-lymphocyte antigen CD19 n=1 Tax=Gekko japonicus TaxID=146911 RepID=A0ABM1L5Q9_GEKJA|nr:PREDICTED: B-lymphocyte antigen CD19 [Gekko japonicus]